MKVTHQTKRMATGKGKKSVHGVKSSKLKAESNLPRTEEVDDIKPMFRDGFSASLCSGQGDLSGHNTVMMSPKPGVSIATINLAGTSGTVLNNSTTNKKLLELSDQMSPNLLDESNQVMGSSTSSLYPSGNFHTQQNILQLETQSSGG